MNYSTGRFSSGFLSGLLFFTIYLLWVEIVLYSSASIIKYLVNIHLLLDTVPCASKKLVGTLTSHSIQRCIYQIFQHWYTRIQFYPLSQSRMCLDCAQNVSGMYPDYVWTLSLGLTSGCRWGSRDSELRTLSLGMCQECVWIVPRMYPVCIRIMFGLWA